MNPWNLTEREQEVLATIGKLGSAKVTGKELGISHRTVEIYLRRVREKMKTAHTVIAVLEWDRYVFRRMVDCERAE